MKKLRVLVLVREGLEPPDTIDGLSDDDLGRAPWKTEYDVVTTLKELGHEAHVLSVFSDLAVLARAIEEWKPHIAFNLLEEFAGVACYDQNVVAYLELAGLPYTGCNPRGLLIARDKALSKKILAYHRIRVPMFHVFPYGRRIRRPKRMNFPLIVKSVAEDASLGIAKASLVEDDTKLQERVAFVHQYTGADAIAEEFIDGRELYVGVVGNRRLEVLPVWELLFENKPDDYPLIYTATAKWNVNYRNKWGVTSRAAKNLPAEVTGQLERRCKRLFQVLGLSGYVRFDFRLDSSNKLYFLEANPNPALAYGEDLPESAEKKGISYERLIHRIVSLGLRYKPLRLM